MPREMREEDFSYAANTSAIKDLRVLFIANLHGHGDKASALYDSLGALCVKYLTHRREDMEGAGVRLNTRETRQVANDFDILATHILAGLYSLYDKRLPDVPIDLIEAMEKNCTTQTEIMRRHDFLSSFGQYSQMWIEDFVYKAWNFGLCSHGFGYISALAEAFVIAAEGKGDKAWLTDRDIKEIDAQVKKWTPSMREDLGKILGYG